MAVVLVPHNQVQELLVAEEEQVVSRLVQTRLALLVVQVEVLLVLWLIQLILAMVERVVEQMQALVVLMPELLRLEVEAEEVLLLQAPLQMAVMEGQVYTGEVVAEELVLLVLKLLVLEEPLCLLVLVVQVQTEQGLERLVVLLEAEAEELADLVRVVLVLVEKCVSGR